mgnify:CR=1 FL=1
MNHQKSGGMSKKLIALALSGILVLSGGVAVLAHGYAVNEASVMEEAVSLGISTDGKTFEIGRAHV